MDMRMKPKAILFPQFIDEGSKRKRKTPHVFKAPF